MVTEIRITGAEQLRALGKELRAMGEEGKGFRKELLKSMRVSGKPVILELRKSAREVLPKKGGLNEFIATSNIVVRNSLVGNKVGTRIVAKKAGGGKGWHDLEAFDNGSFRHPTRGRKAEAHLNRIKWVQQSCPPGWFTKPAVANAPVQQAAILEAMTVTELKIAKGK